MIKESENSAKKSPEILIAEDSPTQAEQIKHLLESHNYKVTIASDGKKAMDWLAKHKPSLVISDIMMPEINGFELCKRIKFNKITSKIPVILLTRLSDSEEIIEGLSCGADSFITKPYNEDHLLSNIARFISNENHTNQKKVPFGVQIFYKGEKRLIQAEQQNVINLMLSIYEGAIQQNEKLIQTKEELRSLNEKLEAIVEERTLDLIEEIKVSKLIAARLKESERELLSLNTQLEHRVIERTKQLESSNSELESFSFSVSHDLRTPLRHIGGFINLLTESNSAKLNNEGLRYLKIISDSTVEMGDLIDALLAFSRLGRTKLQLTPINSNSIVRNVLRTFTEELTGRKVELNIKELPDALGDENLIRQVWINLISNALKYSRKVENAVIDIGGKTEDDKAIFFIKDNGAGFDMKYSDKLFSVFQRLHKEKDFEGIGIGLANVNRIIMRHGGNCRAEGEVGKGATFYFSLPCK
jgi:two-component system, sensor histidine kinase and response regulator